jgi:hypothetical protein
MRNWTQDPQGIINYFALIDKKKLFPRILIKRGMTFKFEYLGKFKLIFENNLKYQSGDQEGVFEEKNKSRKSPSAYYAYTQNDLQIRISQRI